MNFDQQINTFLHELKKFQYRYDGDLIWQFVFFYKKNKWHEIHVRKYKETFYISLIDADITPLEIVPGQKVRTIEHGQSPFDISRPESEDIKKRWHPFVIALLAWLKQAEHNWIKVNALTITNYPLNRRKGYVLHSLIRNLVPDIYRIDQDLGKRNTLKFIKLHQNGYFWNKENTERSTMTARTYFEYCKIAYIAAKRKDDHVDESLSGLEMYKQYADGRHEGLLDIEIDSEEEFAAWVDHTHPKRSSGGHPWEIKRGGNTTHIDLYVTRPNIYNPEKSGFVITISAPAISRSAEAIRMFLALYQAGMPINISDPDAIVRRLFAQDNIGIVPSYNSLHRANQSYPKDQDVYDVMYYDDLGKAKRKIKPFITWEPLPILVPINN